ncbi:MAG: hypothetical protein NTV03_02545 [Candidatus Nomurabacteria bacterium]|nr:hypothetical protein [Candidatus Nomurabacteria bacterium]
MADFLTDRGKQIAKRLDEITIEIKDLAIEDLKIINIERISTLLEEWKNLLYE